MRQHQEQQPSSGAYHGTWEAPDNILERLSDALMQLVADDAAPFHLTERDTLRMAANALGRVQTLLLEGPVYPNQLSSPKPSTKLQPTAKSHARQRLPVPPPGYGEFDLSAVAFGKAKGKGKSKGFKGKGYSESRKRKLSESLLLEYQEGEYGQQLVSMESVPYEKRAAVFQNKLKKLVDGGELEKANAIIEEAHVKQIPGVSLKLNWLVQAYAQAKQPAVAASFCERMEPEFGVRPSWRTYKLLVDGFAADGDAESAGAWHNKMIENGFDPDVRSD